MTESIQTLDLARCRKALQSLCVQGCPDRPVAPFPGRERHASDSRMKAIEDALTAIQTDGTKALAGQFIGVKNYDGFGDQREDYRYGCCPRHGSIVFSIKRRGAHDVPLGADHVYLLVAVRDFESIPAPESGRPLLYLNLCNVIERADRLATEHELYANVLAEIAAPAETIAKASDGGTTEKGADDAR